MKKILIALFIALIVTFSAVGVSNDTFNSDDNIEVQQRATSNDI